MSSRNRFALRAGYAAIVLLATFSGLSPEWTLAPVPGRLARALIPDLHGGDVLDAIRNAALFAGMSAVWIVTEGDRRMRSSIVHAVLASTVLSAFIELIQLFSPTRTASILDIITDTLGGFVGAVLVALLVVATRRTRSPHALFGVPAWLLAASYSGAVLAESAGPLFRQRIIGVTGVDPIDRLNVAIAHSTFQLDSAYVALDLLLDAVLFFPAGALWVLAIREKGRSSRRYLWLIASIATAAFAAAEALHGIFGVAIVPLSIPAHVAGVMAGVIAMRHYRGVGQDPAKEGMVQSLLFAYGGILLLWGTRPFVPGFDYQAIMSQLSYEQLVPMQSLAIRKDLYSVTHVIRQALLFFPAGAVLAVWPISRHRWLSNLLPVLYLAVAIEIAHLFIPARFFDTTNILLSLSGAALGWLVVRSAEVDLEWLGAVWNRGPSRTRVRARHLG